MAETQAEPTNQPETPPSWNGTIKHYFAPCEINCMKMATGIDLSKYDVVKQNGPSIYQAVSTHQMPKGGPYWSDSWVQTFQAWMNAGYPAGNS